MDKKQKKKIIKKYVTMFFIAALSICIIVWATTSFKDLREPYLSVSCAADNFKPCVNPYYEQCKLNDCSSLKPEIYTNEFIKAGETIGEQPPPLIYFLPTILSLIAIILSGLCITEIKKNGMAEKTNKERERNIK